jgi:predicted metal-dependent hydrolase
MGNLGRVGQEELRSIEGLGECLVRRSLRARHYRLSLRRDGLPIVTVPLHASERGALAFAVGQGQWLEKARARLKARPKALASWAYGSEVLWRGERPVLHPEPVDGTTLRVRLGTDVFLIKKSTDNLKPALEAAFLRLAGVELPARAWELAARACVELRRVSVRDQRSRWGSCSARGTVSLNWRLIQAPPAVRDYIIHHELAHLLEMNHSRRFWFHVERLCPGWREAEAWLKKHTWLMERVGEVEA